MRILFLFVDGMGLGAAEPALNPFLHVPMVMLHKWFGAVPTRDNGRYKGAAALLVPTDATLGVPGLPQSGTGQTTIFTGVNAAAAIGRHEGPYPNAALQKLLAHDNLFQRVLALDLTVAFANAYPPFFFDRLARGKARRTATMQAALAAGVPLRGVNELARGEAVSALSMTNQFWIEHGASVPLITPFKAGQNLARLAARYHLTVFEYALPDMAGHKSDRSWMLAVLEELDALWSGIMDVLDPQDMLLLITSDHGNIEDWTVKGHTLNPVPTILIGSGRAALAPHIHDLTDLTPAVVTLLREQEPKGEGD